MADRNLTQWVLGVWPSMPGFVAAVNSTIKVSIGWTHLYYISFLVGTAISALAFIALHRFFPVRPIRDYVNSAPSRRIVQSEYRAKWDGEEVANIFHRPKEDEMVVEQFPHNI